MQQKETKYSQTSVQPIGTLDFGDVSESLLANERRWGVISCCFSPVGNLDCALFCSGRQVEFLNCKRQSWAWLSSLSIRFLHP